MVPRDTGVTIRGDNDPEDSFCVTDRDLPDGARGWGPPGEGVIDLLVAQADPVLGVGRGH